MIGAAKINSTKAHNSIDYNKLELGFTLIFNNEIYFKTFLTNIKTNSGFVTKNYIFCKQSNEEEYRQCTLKDLMILYENTSLRVEYKKI